MEKDSSCPQTPASWTKQAKNDEGSCGALIWSLAKAGQKVSPLAIQAVYLIQAVQPAQM